MIKLLCFLMLCFLSMPAHAQDRMAYGTFEELPVLDQGRIKPLGAVARARLKDFYGHETWQGHSATAWIVETLFNPSEAANFKIFTIKDPELKTLLGLNIEADAFNIAELQTGLQNTQNEITALLQAKQSEITPLQKSLLKIHENTLSYTELLRSFSLILPLNVAPPDDYNITQENPTFEDLLPIEQRVLNDLKTIVAKKGENIDSYNESEKATALLSFQLQQIRNGGMNNDDLKIIPSTLNETLSWIAPWQIINDGQGSPQTLKMLQQWRKIAQDYRDQKADTWEKDTAQLLSQTREQSNEATNKTRLKTELIYLKIKPYHVAMMLYALGIACALFGFIKPQSRLYQPTKWIGLASLCAALLFHTFGIAARIYILDRPPVGTLYESVLFVSLICAGLAFLTAIKSQKTLIPIIGQIIALALLSIAPIMLQNNDSLELLVAVLNTNFWLGTHVICITAGYAICILSAGLAHAYMVLRLKNPQHPALNGLFQTIHKTGLVALLLTAVGTVLGGIWADQSWGRFWGWDPKENGALFIVLWIIWVQHGRLSGKIRSLAYVAGIAALNIIVALAWFGVNLLGVGLHSYGFTSGIASGLATFCIIEILTIISLWISIRTREKRVLP